MGWGIIQWASRLVAVSKLAIWLFSGAFLTTAAAVTAFATEHYVIATVSTTLAALTFGAWAFSYAYSAPPGSYHPRYLCWYRFPLRKVVWRTGGLDVTPVKDGRIVIGEFHCSFYVRRGRVHPKRFVLMFDGRPTAVSVSIQVGNHYYSCDDIEFIPSGAWMQCRARILKDLNKPDDGVTNHPSVHEYYSLLGSFDLVFEAEEYKFERRYKLPEIDMMIRGQENILHPPAPKTPMLKQHIKSQAGHVEPGDTDLGKELLGNRWMLNFNPKSENKKKEISFNRDGTFGEGRNKNEHTWKTEGDVLEIVRENGDLQNRFTFEKTRKIFVCTNEPHAKGIQNQTITTTNGTE